MYVDAQVRKARPFEKMNRKLVVVCPSDEEWKLRREKQDTEGEKNIPDDSVNEMKGKSMFVLVRVRIRTFFNGYELHDTVCPWSIDKFYIVT